MKIKSILFITSILFFAASCTKHQLTSADLTKKIDSVSMNLSYGFPDTVYLNTLSKQITEFVNTNPTDTANLFLLMKLAGQLEAHKKYNQCLSILDDVQIKYPKSKEAVQALITQGFIYNSIGNFDKAKSKYTDYLEKHSDFDSNLTKSIQLELENMGKSPEQILNEIQGKIDSSAAKNG